MQRRQPARARVAAALLFAITLSACSRTAKPNDNGMGLAMGYAAAAMYKPPSTGGPPGKVILPNPKVIGCSTSSCPPVLADGTDPRAVYPWQVSLDYTNGSVIGLVALYDEPTSINDVKAVIEERYGKWAFYLNGKTPGGGGMWRVEPEKFVISLSTNYNGMVQVTYLIFDAKHPTSEKVLEKIMAHMAKGADQ